MLGYNSTIDKVNPLNVHRYIREPSPIKSPRSLLQKKPKTAMITQNESFNPSRYTTYGIDINTVQTYKTIFDMFDTECSGKLTPTELRNLFAYIDINTNRNEIFKVLCDYDLKENGYLDFDDFLKVMTDRIKPFEIENPRVKKSIFNQLTNKKQELGIEELEAAFFKYGYHINKEELQEIFTIIQKRADKIGGNIDFDDFNKVLLEINQELKKELQDTKF